MRDRYLIRFRAEKAEERIAKLEAVVEATRARTQCHDHADACAVAWCHACQREADSRRALAVTLDALDNTGPGAEPGPVRRHCCDLWDRGHRAGCPGLGAEEGT